MLTIVDGGNERTRGVAKALNTSSSALRKAVQSHASRLA